MKIVITVFVVCLINIHSHAKNSFNDSGYRKRGFHIMLSINPVLLKLSSTNPANLLYSKIRFEAQYNFKRNFIGMGVYGNKGSITYHTNGVPITETHQNIFILPTYSNLFLSKKKWEIYGGLGFVYKYNDSLKTSKTSLETLTRHTIITEIGATLFGRINYRFNQRLSIAIELPLYITQINSRTKENYPLTPSMSSDIKAPVKNQIIYFIPSNIFLRVSI